MNEGIRGEPLRNKRIRGEPLRTERSLIESLPSMLMDR
jgi:hypothetical protein